MEFDLKSSALRYLIEITYMLGLVLSTIIFFFLGMLLTDNNLPNHYPLSLILAGLIGGFWGYGLQEIPKTIEKEIDKARSYQSRRGLIKKWWEYLGIILFSLVAISMLMDYLDIITIIA